MTRSPGWLALAAAWALLAGCATERSNPDDAGDKAVVRSLPAFACKDPAGERHEIRELAKASGVVIVVTAPVLAQQSAQEGWSEQLLAKRPGDGPSLVFLEDMSQSWFPSTARERMQKEFKPESLPLLLLDEEGEARRALGVGEDQTVVLVYDRTGTLVHEERGEPSPALAEQIWGKLTSAGS